MTSKDILELSPESKSSLGWMKEIAYQLAVMNESNEVIKSPGFPSFVGAIPVSHPTLETATFDVVPRKKRK